MPSPQLVRETPLASSALRLCLLENPSRPPPSCFSACCLKGRFCLLSRVASGIPTSASPPLPRVAATGKFKGASFGVQSTGGALSPLRRKGPPLLNSTASERTGIRAELKAASLDDVRRTPGAEFCAFLEALSIQRAEEKSADKGVASAVEVYDF